jgi:Zn ribbon nucleic-acid-binding protein
MAVLGYDADDCPKCGSDDLRLWHSHYCQAYFVICNQCGHEDGREREAHEAVRTWSREALKEPKP